MKPLLIAIMAGIPYRIGDEFVSKFRRRLPDASIISWLSLEFSESYSNSYARRLYEHVAAKLKSLDRSDRYDLLLDANLVLLYVDKEDGQESVIFSRFGVEALIIPMRVPNIRNLPLITGNQRQNAVNTLVSEGERAIKRAWRLLPVIAEEVTNRDSKTCLLLPRNNFGEKVNRVLSCVRNASFARVKADQFKRDIDVVSQMLPTARDGKRTYFVGRSGMVFKSPGKAHGRHGLAPAWNALGHESSCVIQGRMRFGASYDSKFHYDCGITRDAGRRFPSCHGEESMPRGRTHVNIAPNDNVR